jgi:hypothetical protein
VEVAYYNVVTLLFSFIASARSFAPGSPIWLLLRLWMAQTHKNSEGFTYQNPFSVLMR